MRFNRLPRMNLDLRADLIARLQLAALIFEANTAFGGL
jgi:hypothetical protein